MMSQKSLFKGAGAWLLLGLVLLGGARGKAVAVTLEELMADASLTPSTFARYFSDFNYQFQARVQEPGRFLARQTGDCDDYAVCAAYVLGQKGFTPRLIAVRMPGEVTHVVCYIEETRSYLDYNNRSFLFKTVKCENGIGDVAVKVAKSFKAKWSSASEFTFEDGLKRLVKTVVEEERVQFASK